MSRRKPGPNRRRVPVVFFVSVLMIAATAIITSVSLPASAAGTTTLKLGMSPDCIPCPGHPYDCYPNCPPPPPPCNPPTIYSPGVQIQSGYRQAWVNWSDSGASRRVFAWGTNTNYGSPVPSWGPDTVNLNALSAGTTYYYEVSEQSSCGKWAYATGSFTTANAPTTQFVGWVSTMDSNSYLIDRIGASISGAPVWIVAQCYVATFVGGVEVAQLQSVGLFDGVTTNSQGYYTLSFPQATTYVSGSYQETWSMSASGVCSTSDTNGYHWSVTDTAYNLMTEGGATWYASQYVSSTLSVTNDYRQFGVLTDQYPVAAVGVAFIHTPYAQCGVTIQNGFSQSVNQFVGGSGNAYLGSWSQEESNLQPYGNDSSVAFTYETTGLLNESNSGTSVVVNTWADSGPLGPVLGDSFPDPFSSPPATDPSHILTINTGGLIDGLGFKNGGSNTSTGGLDMNVGVSGGWGGGFSLSMPLIYTTSVTSSTQKELNCSFHDPSSSQKAQFYFYVDGTQTAIGEAVNVHIWFDDLCTSC